MVMLPITALNAAVGMNQRNVKRPVDLGFHQSRSMLLMLFDELYFSLLF